jgi:hypothetical protein
MQLLLYLLDSAGGAGTRGFSGRRHCDQRHRRLSAWDRRRNRQVGVQSGSYTRGWGEPQQRSSVEHPGSIYSSIG